MLLYATVNTERMEELLQHLDVLADEDVSDESMRETVQSMVKDHSYIKYLVADLKKQQEQMERLNEVGNGHFEALSRTMMCRRDRQCPLTKAEREMYGCEHEGMDWDDIQYDDLFLEFLYASSPRNPYGEDANNKDGTYYFLLSTGGPACRFVYTVEDDAVKDAYMEVNDWFMPWVRKQSDEQQRGILKAIAEDLHGGYGGF